jgi:hypothetical protein
MLKAIETWGDTGKEVSALPEQITCLRVDKDSIIIAKVPHNTDMAIKQSVRKILQEELGIKVLVMTEEIELSVVTEDPPKSERVWNDTATTDVTFAGIEEDIKNWQEKIYGKSRNPLTFADVQEAVENGYPLKQEKIWEPAKPIPTMIETEEVKCEDCDRDWGHSYCGTCGGKGYLIREKKPEIPIISPSEHYLPPKPIECHQCRTLNATIKDGKCNVCGIQIIPF